MPGQAESGSEQKSCQAASATWRVTGKQHHCIPQPATNHLQGEAHRHSVCHIVVNRHICYVEHARGLVRGECGCACRAIDRRTRDAALALLFGNFQAKGQDGGV